jgi:hypothetical protein
MYRSWISRAGGAARIATTKPFGDGDSSIET